MVEGPSRQRGLFKPNWRRRRPSWEPSARSSRASTNLQSERYSLFKSGPFLSLHWSKNWGEAFIDDKLTTCLLYNGSQLNFVTPAYAHERGMDILSLDTLARR